MKKAGGRKRWGREEDEALPPLVRQNLTLDEIGERLGFSPDTIQRHGARLELTLKRGRKPGTFDQRNTAIRAKRARGAEISTLAKEYDLSESTIVRICGTKKQAKLG